MPTDRGLFSNVRGDLFGGLTAGIVALPLALAFGGQTELGAIAGLYGAIGIGLLAAVFGGTATQISGPTAPMTVVSAVVISDTIAVVGDFAAALPIIFATFAAAGLFQVALGLTGVGKYIKYVPYPVVSGFMTGIGVIILITQLIPFVGGAAPEGGVLGTIKALKSVPSELNVASAYAVGLALLAIALIYLTPRVTSKVPGALVALAVITPLALLLPPGVVTTLGSDGPLPSGLPDLQFDLVGAFAAPGGLTLILEYGITLALLGAIDSLLTSVVADNLTRTRHDPNRELIGQGIGNVGAALIGGLPGAGATIRTVVNVNAGGRTKLSGVIAASLLAAILLGLGSLVGYIPKPVLAGILITVGIGVIDYKGLRDLSKVSRADASVLLIVLLLTVFWSLLNAVAVGMFLALFLYIKHTDDLISEQASISSLSDRASSIPWADEDKAFVEEFGNRVYIKRLDGALFFGFAQRFREILAEAPTSDVVVIRMRRVPYVDQTGLYAMEEAVLDLERRGVEVVLTGLREQPRHMLEGIGLIGGLIGRDQVFEKFSEVQPYLKEFFARGGRREERLVEPGDIREA